MQERGLYSTDPAAIRERVRSAGLENVFQPEARAAQAAAV
jgi:hypothetical protein